MLSARFLFVCFALCFVGTFAATSTERNALLDFYYQTGGEQWTNATNWLVGDPCMNKWFGIKCKDSHVIGIYLLGNNVYGQIPESFGDLTWMTGFDLSENQLDGKLPESMGHMKNLRAIGLRKNKIGGPLPESLGVAPLGWVHLDFNQFTSIPASLAASTTLRVLGLTDNLVSELPDLGRLTGLHTLLLGGNRLSGPWPRWIKKMASLSSLDLSRNALSGTIPVDAFEGLKSLTEVLLFGNGFVGALPSSLQGISSLVVLDAHANRFDGALPAWIGSAYPHMQILHLQHNHFTGRVPHSLMGQRIPSVDLSGNPFACPIPAWARYTHATCAYDKHAVGDDNAAAFEGPDLERGEDNGDVKVAFYGESKCPDMASMENEFEEVMRQVGSIMRLTVGFIAYNHPKYPTGFWSLHGQGEVLGDIYELCALHTAGASQAQAFRFLRCMNADIVHVPLKAAQCARDTGFNATALTRCAMGPAGHALLKRSLEQARDDRAYWSPTLYINGQNVCLWHLTPCSVPRGAADIVQAICRAYTGPKPLPAACRAYP